MGNKVKIYDDVYKKIWGAETLTRTPELNPRKQMAINMCPNDVDMALEIGCGPGDFLQLLEHKGISAVGIDLSNFALSRARHVSKKVLKADAEKLPFKKDIFDLIIAIDVLEHIENDKLAFETWVNMLRAGGVIILSVPYNKKLWDIDDEKVGHYRRYNYADLQNLMTQNNLQLTDIKYSGFPFYRLARWILNRMQKYRKTEYTTGCIGGHIASRNLLLRFLVKCMVGIESCFQNLPYGTSIIIKAEKGL